MFVVPFIGYTGLNNQFNQSGQEFNFWIEFTVSGHCFLYRLARENTEVSHKSCLTTTSISLEYVNPISFKATTRNAHFLAWRSRSKQPRSLSQCVHWKFKFHIHVCLSNNILTIHLYKNPTLLRKISKVGL